MPSEQVDPLFMGHGHRDFGGCPEDPRASLARTIQDGQDAAKYVLRDGLDTTECIGCSMGTRVSLR